jgi:hypothetical protein
VTLAVRKRSTRSGAERKIDRFVADTGLCAFAFSHGVV